MDEMQSIVIHRSVSDVFAFLMDFENDIQWRAELMRIQRLPEFPEQVGAHYEQQVHWEGRTLVNRFEVTHVEMDKRIEFEGRDSGVVAAASYAFEPISDESTRLIVKGHIDTTGPLNVLEPFMRTLVERQVALDLERLQALLEGRDELPPSPESSPPLRP